MDDGIDRADHHVSADACSQSLSHEIESSLGCDLYDLLVVAKGKGEAWLSTCIISSALEVRVGIPVAAWMTPVMPANAAGNVSTAMSEIATASKRSP